MVMTTTRNLQIHPELTRRQGESGVFELPELPGGWRQWVALDSRGITRIHYGMHDRDVDAGLKERLEVQLEQLMMKDAERQA